MPKRPDQGTLRGAMLFNEGHAWKVKINGLIDDTLSRQVDAISMEIYLLRKSNTNTTIKRRLENLEVQEDLLKRRTTKEDDHVLWKKTSADEDYLRDHERALMRMEISKDNATSKEERQS